MEFDVMWYIATDGIMQKHVLQRLTLEISPLEKD